MRPVTSTAIRPDAVAPRAATVRDPGSPTDGAAGAFVAKLYGRPWLPWQRAAADLIGERRPDGRYRYPVAVVTVPRQCGKTTWAIDLALGRCLMDTDYRAAYTAQTGHVVTERFRERMDELAGGLLNGAIHTRRSAGTESFTVAGRSYLKAFPPKDGALRGSALDLVIVDEAQEHDEGLGEALDQTIIPTFTTRPRRQLILVGTAGTVRSAYLRRYLENARAGSTGYALVDYGARPDTDTDDPATWATFHPGLGHLTDVEALRIARDAMGPAAFAREYCNIWTRTSVRVVDPEQWAAALTAADFPRPAGRLCLGVDVAADRGSAAIAISATSDTNRYVEVVDAHSGTDWVTGGLLELQATHGAPVAIDRFGAVGTVADALELAGANLIPMKTQDVANAAAGLLDDLENGTLSVYPSPALTEAVDGVAKRPLGDGNGFAFSRRASSAPIAPLVAVAAARWGLARLPAPAIRPQIHAG